MSSYEKLEVLWGQTPENFCRLRRAYNIDEAVCIATEIDLQLKTKTNIAWFFVIMLLTLNVYRKDGLFTLFSPGLLQEIQKHHCYRYKDKVVLEQDESIHVAQTMEYIKLRNKLRQELRVILHRFGSSP